MLEAEGLPLHGFCRFEAVADSLLKCRAAERLKNEFADSPPKTLIVALFPYRKDDRMDVRLDNRPCNLSRYARVPDYHSAAGAVLERAAVRLREAYPADHFLPLIDNSPIPEVKAAALAGLGCVGENGLLIHPDYGSWVFIGTIVTDLPLELPRRKITSCRRCGICAAACPGQCLDGRGTRDTCLSKITQKKGTLSGEEQKRMRDAGTAWGCDRCQEVCPLNAHTKIEPHPCFAGAYTPELTEEAMEHLEGKAYGWRGRAVLERNLMILK